MLFDDSAGLSRPEVFHPKGGFASVVQLVAWWLLWQRNAQSMAQFENQIKLFLLEIEALVLKGQLNKLIVDPEELIGLTALKVLVWLMKNPDRGRLVTR